MTIRRELIDELLKDYADPQDVLAEDGLLKQLTKAVIERCLETELETHLGYAKHARAGTANANRRNGHSQKTRPRRARTPGHRGTTRPASQRSARSSCPRAKRG